MTKDSTNDELLNPYEWIPIHAIPGLQHDMIDRIYMQKTICRKKTFKLPLLDQLRLIIYWAHMGYSPNYRRNDS